MNETPPSLNMGNPRVAGTDRTMWGKSWLTLYGTPDKPQLFSETPMRGACAFNVERDDLVRFARELLGFLGESMGLPELPAWRPASDGAGSRSWFLTRYSDVQDMTVPMAARYYYGTAGQLVRYGSQAAAQRTADTLNGIEGKSAA